MKENLKSVLNRPLAIGSRTIHRRLVAAPMTQVGNVAHRELLAGYGGYGLLFSEMCGAKRIPAENRHVSPYFRWRDEERDRLSVQIVGADPAEMAEAARRIEAEGLFGVDINFGCSVSAICNRNIGAAVLRDPAAAAAIVRAVRRAVAIPLTVKFRTGWTDDPAPAVEMARRLEAAGADALTFHPRVAPDRRLRPPRWEYIGQVKDAVSIPVFGNGDVFSAEDCLRMLETTGCDGVALGRMGIARPWVFAEWTEGFSPGPDEYGKVANRLFERLPAYFDPARALARFKRFAYYFSANFRFGHSFYAKVQNAPDMATVRAAIDRFFATPPSLSSRPNMNFFL